MLTAELQAQVATRLLRDVEREVKTAVNEGAKPLGDQLAARIRASSGGPGAYSRVYRKLGAKAKVRTRAGRPPEVVVGGSSRFSGGATVNQLVWGYEYGSATGNLRRGQRFGGTSSRRRHTVRRGGRARHYQTAPQFPPWNQQGWWVNEIVDEEKEPILDGWVRLVNDALDDVARKDHG